ncbi:unnamed protein product [Brassica napus]|uniref:(rape) hypothetical protein n=1 Tax=Brassica napus TaxID=3708 RepID=A0A816Z873_BRANA|nr:unnamed protein product [Brassica napus]
MSERRSVVGPKHCVLALPALSQYPAILHRNNRRMFCGLNEAVQANESEAISISDEDHGNPISSVYSENNCVRGRAGGRGRNHRRGRGRGRGRGRDNHDLGGPSRNSSDNRSLRQRCPVLGSQVNNDVVEVVNLESYTDEDDLSHYTVLGLTPFPSQAEVKRAFKRLALKYHPDVQKGQEKDFKEIISAYECLMQKFESQEEEEVEEITELDATDEWEEWMGFEGGIPSSVYTSF